PDLTSPGARATTTPDRHRRHLDAAAAGGGGHVHSQPRPCAGRDGYRARLCRVRPRPLGGSLQRSAAVVHSHRNACAIAVVAPGLGAGRASHGPAKAKGCSPPFTPPHNPASLLTLPARP